MRLERFNVWLVLRMMHLADFRNILAHVFYFVTFGDVVVATYYYPVNIVHKYKKKQRHESHD